MAEVLWFLLAFTPEPGFVSAVYTAPKVFVSERECWDWQGTNPRFYYPKGDRDNPLNPPMAYVCISGKWEK